ncbi:MAG: MoaD/ThiS family protein [Candidatus Aenigmarchaeota archaeon]|nr:MoaD/ThiS family protein [Candidatus Aenigmarchaeota archaeon]
MDIAVKYENKDKNIEIDSNQRISDIMKKMDINAETVIVKVNGAIEPEDITLKKEDKIEIIKIISGG